MCSGTKGGDPGLAIINIMYTQNINHVYGLPPAISDSQRNTVLYRTQQSVLIAIFVFLTDIQELN
jgi:hypothetical protein